MPHVLNYGASGAGKTTLAASSDTPQLIAFFDALDEETGGNARPFFIDGQIKKTFDTVYVNGTPTFIPTYLVYDPNDNERLVRKLWHFSPSSPVCIEQFKVKWTILESELREISAKTFIVDSLTLYTSSLRVQAENNGRIEEGQIGLYIANHMRDLCTMLASLPTNVILSAHVSGESYTKQVRRGGQNQQITARDSFVAAPGQMSRNIKAYFSDVWYSYIDDDGQYLVATSKEGEFTAKNTVNADALCPNDYREIVKNAKPLKWITE